ncbi:hypothetical protein [Phaffia rhodozyma]|uniref:Uncharacterized protein n=1 Tax=Phaffia rhodozyma TaxID=264483 RepID=A0A0F7SKU3_PHARH|nr:hypothetical protein [Phaffia rhodozyma]
MVNVDSEETQSENVCQFCIEPRSIVTAQEHDQAVFHHLEPGVSSKTTAVDPIWAPGKDGSDDSEGPFDPNIICCPLPIDELVPSSPLLCSSPMVEIDMPELWSLDGETIEEEEEKETEPDVIVESGDSKTGVWTIDGVQSIQDHSLTSTLRPFNTTTLPGGLLSLIKHDTLNWYGHLYLQHILSTAVNIFAPSPAAFRSKTGFELTIYLREVANLPLIGMGPSVSAEFLSLSAQADMQMKEEKEDTPSSKNLDSSTEISDEATPVQEPMRGQLHGNLCKKCSWYMGCSSEKGSTSEYSSKTLVMTSVELSAQSGSEEENESSSDSTVEGRNDSEKIIARRRMFSPVLLYTPFKLFQLLPHQGGSRHQMYHPILGLLAKSLGGLSLIDEGFNHDF